MSAPRGKAPRFLPPVHSPLTLGAIAAGLRAMTVGGEAARHALGGLIRTRWAPEQFVMTDSGTSALALGLMLANRLGRAPVALPAYGCYDLATAVDAAGVPFTLYDVDPLTLGPEPESLQLALARGARSVVVVHMYGIPADLDAVRAVAGPDVLLIEDAAQGAGIQRDGRAAGTHGDLGVLSFGRGKGMTGGRGGALLLNRADLGRAFSELVEELPGGGRGSPGDALRLLAQWLLARPWLYAIPTALPWLGLGETVYRPAHSPAGLASLSAGVAEQTIRLVRGEALARRRTATLLAGRLEGRPGITMAGRVPAGWEAGWLRFPALFAPSLQARSTRLRPYGVYPGYPKPLSRLPGFGERAVGGGGLRFPGAEQLAAELVTFPVHSLVTPADVEAVALALPDSLGQGALARVQ